MSGFNMVVLLGNLTNDPELRYTTGASPIAVCTFTLAVNRVKKGGAKETIYMKCVAWAGAAETLGKFIRKGNPLLVQGHLVTRTWETKEKEKRSVTETVVEQFQFVGGKGSTPEPARPEEARPEKAPDHEDAGGFSEEGRGPEADQDYIPF